jgi:hypothetical protein
VLLEEALAEAGSRPALQKVIHCRLAWATRFRKGYVRALEHATAAVELADGLGDSELRERGQAVQAVLGWIAGNPDRPPLPARPHDFATAVGGPQLVQEATFAVVSTLAGSNRRTKPCPLLHEHDEWRERDEPRSAPGTWSRMGRVLGRALGACGRPRCGGLRHRDPVRAQECLRTTSRSRSSPSTAGDSSSRASTPRVPSSSPRSSSLSIRPSTSPSSGSPPRAGDRATAEEWLAKAEAQAAALAWGEPSIRWWSADYVELLLELGRVDEAVRILDAWEEDATRLGRDWVLAHATRCRGLVAAAHGNPAVADSLLEQAVARHEGLAIRRAARARVRADTAAQRQQAGRG